MSVSKHRFDIFHARGDYINFPDGNQTAEQVVDFFDRHPDAVAFVEGRFRGPLHPGLWALLHHHRIGLNYLVVCVPG